jgi:hypothetical protein
LDHGREGMARVPLRMNEGILLRNLRSKVI